MNEQTVCLDAEMLWEETSGLAITVIYFEWIDEAIQGRPSSGQAAVQ